ncbi:MAG: pilus assembly protein HicB [Pseudomonadota bacterium]|nr:pilus assembly protein HicB [Pseudomonadota bacterium]
MNPSEQYHKWVEWSDEDQVYVGKCPDLITGIHGDEPIRLYAELLEVVEDIVRHFESEGVRCRHPVSNPCRKSRERRGVPSAISR